MFKTSLDFFPFAVALTALTLLIFGPAGAAMAEPRVFLNFQAEVPSSWTLLSETVSADQQSTLVKFVSGDQKVNLSLNVENTAKPARELVSRLVEIYGGDRVFQPFKSCGDYGFRQRNPGGGWLALCALGDGRLMSLVLDGRETRELTRFVASIREPGRPAPPAPSEAAAPPSAPAGKRRAAPPPSSAR